jgi:UDP-N-acetylmuramoyl-tripeptide--D-alanyl-D-alanine ligase
VFEMGMNHSGELAELTQLVRPHIAIVTWVASAHREFFATESDIAMAKAEIFAGLPKGGTAIIPHDNPHADLLAGAAADAGAKVVRFGLNDGADVHAEKVALHPDCSCVTARIGKETLTFKIGMAGQHWVNNALAVLAGVQAAGADLALAGLALAELNDLPGRGRRLRVAAGAGQAIVIDEAYNANPASMAASFAVLKAVTPARHGRRLALLGSMKELGALSDEFHAGLAPHIREAGVAAAVLVGAEMKPLAAALGRSIDVRHSTDRAGTPIATWPIGATQTRVSEPRERAKQNQIECEKQGEHRDGTQFGIHRLVPTVIQRPNQGQQCNEHAHTQQSQGG